MGNKQFREQVHRRKSSLQSRLSKLSKHSKNSKTSGPSRKGLEKAFKVVFLGPGDSGKSTVLRMLKVILSESTSFSRELEPIQKHFIKQVAELFCLLPPEDFSEPLAEEIRNFQRLDTSEIEAWFDPALLDFIGRLWEDEVTKEYLRRNRGSHCLPETLDYFVRHRERVLSTDFEPTEEDFLKQTYKTSGIVEKKFILRDEILLTLVDTGGQRSERKKWRTATQGANLLIFTASLSEFDQTLFEDPTVKRSTETLGVFKELLANLMGMEESETGVLVLFTKRDVLMKKLEMLQEEDGNLDDFFPDLGMGTDFDSAQEKIEDFLLESFKAEIPPEFSLDVDFHFINDYDKDRISGIFNSVVDDHMNTE